MSKLQLPNILFVQDSSPCIRTIKVATALAANGISIHIAHRGRTPDEVYGYGNSAFKTLTLLHKFKYREIPIIKEIIKKEDIHLVHFHNQPDRLGAKLIIANLGIPVIYDMHDSMSFKHRLSRREFKDERICNEQANGVVYTTESYKKEVAKHLNIIDNTICYGNYFPVDSTLEPTDFRPKLSDNDGECHIVYLGRISEKKTDHRYIIEILSKLSDRGFIIHLYPSKNREYKKYRRIENLRMHKNLPYNDLIPELSQYNYGITVFNDAIVNKLPHVKYALGNKTYDYMCAGIPILVLDILDEARNFVIDNDFGMVLDDCTSDNLPDGSAYQKIVDRILADRDKFTMENQIIRIMKFYSRTLDNFDAQA